MLDKSREYANIVHISLFAPVSQLGAGLHKWINHKTLSMAEFFVFVPEYNSLSNLNTLRGLDGAGLEPECGLSPWRGIHFHAEALLRELYTWTTTAKEPD